MDKKLTALLTVFVLVFALFMTVVIFNQPITTLTRASEELVPSSDNSLIFAWPLTVKADEKDKAQINVFVRNYKNLPLANKKVKLENNFGKVSTINDTTDKSGKASFFLSSSEKGIVEIKAIVDNQTQIKQTVTIKFE